MWVAFGSSSGKSIIFPDGPAKKIDLRLKIKEYKFYGIHVVTDDYLSSTHKKEYSIKHNKNPPFLSKVA